DASGASYGCEHGLPFPIRKETRGPHHAKYIDRTKLCDLCADDRAPDISMLQFAADVLFKLVQRETGCRNVADNRQAEIAILVDGCFTGQIGLSEHCYADLVTGHDAVLLEIWRLCCSRTGCPRIEHEQQQHPPGGAGQYFRPRPRVLFKN